MDLVLRAERVLVDGELRAATWVPLLPRTHLAPDSRQVFVVDAPAITSLRIQAYRDGLTTSHRQWDTAGGAQ